MSPVLKSWDELAKKNSLKPGRGARDTDTLFKKKLKEKGFTAEQIANIRRNTQASMDGQVPEDLNYSQWLKRQSAKFQDEVLGPTKGKLFRRGDVTLDRFVDRRTGRPFTVAELRKREAAAFEEAALPG